MKGRYIRKESVLLVWGNVWSAPREALNSHICEFDIKQNIHSLQGCKGRREKDDAGVEVSQFSFFSIFSLFFFFFLFEMTSEIIAFLKIWAMGN